MLLIVTAIVPFLTTSLFTSQVNRAADDQTDTYMESLIMAKSISRLLNQHASLFETAPEDLANLALKQDQSDVQLALYSKDRALLHQTEGKQTYPIHLRPSEMMSDLYKMQSQGHAYVYKEPIYLQDQIAGFFELRLEQNQIRKETTEIYVLTVLFFLFISGITLIIVQHWFKRNMLEPFSWMKNEMQEVAFGKRRVEVRASQGRTEVGQLLDDFAFMTSQIRQTELKQISEEENHRKLIAAISHDLKTPLTSIRAYAEGMQSHEEKRDEYAQVILSKTAYMQRLLEDLLVYSQVQATSFSLMSRLVDAEELAELLFDGYVEQWQSYNVVTEIDITPVELFADVDRLVQVVDNLVTNAVRYSPEGGAIKLFATNKAERLPSFINPLLGNHLYFFVFDEGIGIPSGAQTRIFDSFYQVEQARSQTQGKGVGLGLAICRELVQKHGGDIHVHSTPPQGSTFYFTLPYMIEEKGDSK